MNERQATKQAAYTRTAPEVPVKEIFTLIGVVVLFIGSILALVDFIGGVSFPLWLRVAWDLANIIFTIVGLVRALIIEEEIVSYSNKGAGGALFAFLLIGGVVCVIGSFFAEEFSAVHSLVLFAVLALVLAFDIRG